MSDLWNRGATEELTLEGINHVLIPLLHSGREKLFDIENDYPIFKAYPSVIIVDSDKTLVSFSKELEDRGCIVYASKSDIYQERRDSIMQNSGVVISTCNVSGGFEEASFVINYNLPRDPTKYLHRIGRSREFVSKVVAITFVTGDDLSLLFDIQRLFKVSFRHRGHLLSQAGLSQEGSQIGTMQPDFQMSELLPSEIDKLFTSYNEVEKSFEKMNLNDNLLKGIFEYGYKEPSLIQQRGILPLCEGLDVFEQAESEPRRTATFCTAILQKLDCGLDKCQALVLIPPLKGMAISVLIEALGQFQAVEVQGKVKKVKVEVAGNAIPAKDEGAHVVVATPDSVLLMLGKKSLSLAALKIIVLDDADELVRRYSRRLSTLYDLVQDISECLPANVQVCVFSETMCKEVVDLGRMLMRKPHFKPRLVVMKKDKCSNFEGIEHFYVYSRHSARVSALLQLLSTLDATKQYVVLVDNHQMASWLAEKLLAQEKFKVTAMHEEMPQKNIDSMMEDYKAGGMVVITTDTLARGHGFQASFVINFSMHEPEEGYLRRFGIFGRIDAIINFVNEDDWWWLLEIQQQDGIDFMKFGSDFRPAKKLKLDDELSG